MLSLIKNLVDSETNSVQLDENFFIEKTKDGISVIYCKDNVVRTMWWSWLEIAGILHKAGVIDGFENKGSYIRMYTHSEIETFDRKGRPATCKFKVPFLYEDVQISPAMAKRMIAIRELRRDLSKKVKGHILNLLNVFPVSELRLMCF